MRYPHSVSGDTIQWIALLNITAIPCEFDVFARKRKKNYPDDFSNCLDDITIKTNCENKKIVFFRTVKNPLYEVGIKIECRYPAHHILLSF